MEGLGARMASGLAASLGPVRDALGRRRAPRSGGKRAWRRRFSAIAVAAALSVVSRPSASALDFSRLQTAAAAQGPRAERTVAELRDLLARLQSLDDLMRLDAVNSFVNRRVAFSDDTVVWGQNDYWASPLETFARGQGDCEDYAIAKYFALLASGMPTERLRLVYVRAIVSGGFGRPGLVQPHMVLAYYVDNGADPIILDNPVPDIRPASRRADLTPVFSFNSAGLWNGTGGPSVGDPLARLSRWREVMRKARLEGFE
jgi:predicted transglutaminase-like cysteine proteinase